jgi:hypothetical protein
METIAKMASDRKWRVEKSGEYFKGKQHGECRILVRAGREVNECVNPATRRTTYQRRPVTAQSLAKQLTGDEIDEKLKSLLLRVR